MTTSEPPKQAYVWVWLPGAIDPVVAGALRATERGFVFVYGKSYRSRSDAIPLYLPELPLDQSGSTTDELPGALRDAAPDAWGRRVIDNRLGAGRETSVDELTYLLESGSNRIGALDFQGASQRFEPRDRSGTLEQLADAADRIEQGEPLPPALEEALAHGTSIGGARPKSLLTAEDRQLIAKFSVATDTYAIVRAEFVGMSLAAHVGLDVAPVELSKALGRDVLLVERFDRARVSGGWERRLMVSALTILGLTEMEARYASYLDLADQIRHRFTNPSETLIELFDRIVFNVIIGNTDDHARNHAAFWDGARLALTPAYDLCPQARTGGEATQAMRISEGDNRSRLGVCLQTAKAYHLSRAEAAARINAMTRAVAAAFRAQCDAAGVSVVERQRLRTSMLHPSIFYEAPADLVPVTLPAD